MKIFKDGKLMYNLKNGQAIYGNSIGIIMLHCAFPRLPGDIGNATTFDFPVIYRVIREVPHQKIVDERDEEYLEPFINAARDLEAEGVRAITTSCGFLAAFQKNFSEAVNIPLFTSSLVQVPLVYQIIGRKGKIGIIAAEADTRRLSDEHFNEVGWSMKDIPIAVTTLEQCEEFERALFLEGDGPPEMNITKIEEEMIDVVKRLLIYEPDVRAIVVEFTNFGPFASAVQTATNIPIFDIITLTKMVHAACVRTPFQGFL
jgi:hypothetical protein